MPSSEPQSGSKFYLTTPIYYVNARPHIGHAYTTIVADVLARRHRLLGEDTFFLTGTDEHGQKIERSAAAAGIPPHQFADQVSGAFKQLWDRMGLTYNRYIRTTDPAHKRGVQKLFRELYDRGFIYLSTYTGSYCVSDEAFVDQPAGTPCPDCGRLLETVTEENFFFKLSEFESQLLALIESNQLLIEPSTARNEVLSFVRGGLKDLSVSRSSFTWGIPVPADVQHASGTTQPHVVYVWLDALANYMTAIGYGSDDPEAQAEFARYWPADLHLVGKEITRFHCVYWPAFLLAAGLPTPKQITANGWLLFDNAKMSKSRGNVVRTETILDAFGDHVYGKQYPESTRQARDLFASDVLRYFLLREIPFGQDGSFSFDALVTRYNADLANGYGNLVSRTLAMIERYFGGVVPSPRFEGETANASDPGGFDEALLGNSATVLQQRIRALGGTDFTAVLGEISAFVAIVDGFITATAPWKLAKDPARAGRLATVLYQCVEAIRWCTSVLYPFCPTVTAEVWTQLGLGNIRDAIANGDLAVLHWGGLEPGVRLGRLAPIFPRAEKALAQVMIDMEEARSTPALNTSADAKISESSTDPAAPPRTSSLDEPAGALSVGGSHAASATLPTTPGPHTEAPASGVFGTAAQAAAPPPAAEEAAAITIDDFLKVELRVAQVLVAERIPKADKLLRLEVDLGTEKRQILSGIAQWYTPEELIGRRIVVVSNLAPRKMRGLESHGMLLAASEGSDGKPVLATFGEEIALGSRVR